MNTNTLDTLLRIGQTTSSDSRTSRTDINRDDFVRLLQQASTPRETAKASSSAPPVEQEPKGTNTAIDERPIVEEENASPSSQQERETGDSQDQKIPNATVNDETSRFDKEGNEEEVIGDEVVISQAAAATAQVKSTEPVLASQIETEEEELAVESAAENPEQHTARQQAHEAEEAVEAIAETDATSELKNNPEQTAQQSTDQHVEESAKVVDEVALNSSAASKESEKPEPAALDKLEDKKVNPTVDDKAEPSLPEDTKVALKANRSQAATPKAIVPTEEKLSEAESTTAPVAISPIKPETPAIRRAAHAGKITSSDEEDKSDEKNAITVEDSTQNEAIKLPEGEIKSEKSVPTPTASGIDSALPIAATTNSTTGPQANNSSHSGTAASTEPVPTEHRGRFVQRVASAFRHAQQNDGHIQLRLSPPELGSLKIEISVRNGVLSANLETETSEARRVVLDNLPALRHRLAEQEIRIDKFEVDVRRDGGQPQDQGQWNENRARQAQRNNSPKRSTFEGNGAVLRNLAPSATNHASEGLDVRI